MRNIFKQLMLLAFIALLLNGCSAEQDTSYQGSQKVEFRQMKLADLKQFPGALLTVERFPEEILKVANRNVIDTGWGFSIDMDDFTFIGNDSLHTFTFKVERPEATENSKIENLVLTKKSNGEYDTFLLRYSLTAEDKRRIHHGESIENLNQKTEIAKISDTENIASEYIHLDCIKNVIATTLTKHINGEGKLEWVKWEYFTIDCTISITGGGTSSGGTSNGGTSDGGTSGGVSTPANPNSNTDPKDFVYWDPTNITTYPIIPATPANIFVGNLSPEMQAWWAEQPKDYRDAILNYLNQPEADPLVAQSIINYCMENPEFVTQIVNDANSINPNNYPGKEDGLPYQWWLNDNSLEDALGPGYGDVWGQLSQAEKNLSVIFPIPAYKMKGNKPIAESATVAKFNENLRNDKSDAFRHAYFQAINTKKVGRHYAKMFSDAHESEVPAVLIKEKEMDLYNNNQGIQYAIAQPQETPTTLIDAIYIHLVNGYLVYLSPLDWNASPSYDFNGNGQQDCSVCLNGIIPQTQMIFTNQ